MGDPILNCLTTACCPPEKRLEVLGNWLETQGLDKTSAATAAKCILEYFDLAPAGTLTPLVQEIARLAKGEPYKG